MMFTVVRNISVSSDSLAKTELAKKNQAENDEKDGTEDESSDNDIDDILNRFFDFDWSMYNIDTELYDYSNQRYLSTTVSITTPPPKV